MILSRVERAWIAQRSRTVQVSGYTVHSLLGPPEGLFDLETTMVSVLHKELEYKVEKLKYKKF